MAEEAVQFVRQQMKGANRLVSTLQSAEEDLCSGQKLRDDEARCLLHLTGEQALSLLRKQVTAWEGFMAGERVQKTDADAAAPTPEREEARKSKARSKLEQLGAQKLLGGLTMSETDLMSHRKALKSSFSPAAAEMAQLRSLPQTGS